MPRWPPEEAFDHCASSPDESSWLASSLEFRRSRTRAATLDEAWWLKLDAASARYHSERRAARRALTPSALGRGRDN